MHIPSTSTVCPSTGPTASPPPKARQPRGCWEQLLWPGCASLPGPGPTPAPGLMMDKLPPHPGPTASLRRGALEKQAGPGARPAGTDGTELGAHACDRPPVCEHACAHGWVFSHACALPGRLTGTRMHPCARVITHRWAHAWSRKHARVQAHGCTLTHKCSHARTHTYSHTGSHSPARLQCPLPAPQGVSAGNEAAPRHLGPMRCAVPQFPLLAQAGTPHSPGTCGRQCGTS